MGPRYGDFVREKFVEAVLCEQHLQMWFMHDGAPSHIGCDRLSHMFFDCWIGWGGPTHWPVWCQDISLLDSWFWGHVKVTNVTDFDTLQDPVFDACRHISGEPTIFQRVRVSLWRRAEGCIAMDGLYMEELLWKAIATVKGIGSGNLVYCTFMYCFRK